MEKFFNTAGPNKPDLNYQVPPLERWDLDDILALIGRQRYFVLHAPRQTGKTTCLLALMDYLNQQGDYACVYANIETAQVARNNIASGMQAIVAAIADSAELYLGQSIIDTSITEYVARQGETSALKKLLGHWSQKSTKPLVLFLDEVDALVGDTLISLLRQLRAGYNQRPQAFPHSVILCGVRDVRDYRIQSSQEGIITGGSAFNIKSESLRLGNFSKDDIQALYSQHSEHTGQRFEAGCVDYIYQQTGGQPWLVNALGYQACYRSKAKRDRSLIITLTDLAEAREVLIESRAVHLDQLADKLQEPRVQSIVGPILASGEIDLEVLPSDDLQYLLDLGLVTREGRRVAIANPIYREVIPRTLNINMQYNIAARVQSEWYIGADGSLDMHKLLANFQQFFRETSESWIERFHYKESGPQLILQAFLQRVVNGGGRIEREYGLGRGRTDLLVQWPLDSEQGFLGPVQRIVIELKIQHKSLETTIAAGLEQIYDYNQRVGSEQAHLIIFNRDPDTPWEQKCFQRTTSHQDLAIDVWGM